MIAERPALSVVRPPVNETVAARVKRLQAESRALAREHVAELTRALMQVEALAVEIASGGDAYPAGVRDLARRLADDSAARSQTIAAINGRSAA